MPKLKVNGVEVEFEKGMTVLQACEAAGEEIPRFCYHDRLKIAGNCRMCLVQVEGGPPKPVASCAMPAAENMAIHTNTPMVKKAREGVMEFLLANHPLDCPICDQAGECDLQDQSMGYGRAKSRYKEDKRAVKDKYMGPLVKTQMTRCIQCTRCIRFMDQIAGVSELAAVGRGEHMEITTYIEQGLSSELSANIIDLCPVGALTSKPYEFKARPWELRKIETIDVLDAVGSNIRVDVRGREVMRILPRINEDINEEWISDKTRFACDGLKLQRLDRPYVKKDGKLQVASWQEAYDAIAEKINKTSANKIAALVGDLVDCESIKALKDLMTKIGTANIDCRQDGAKISNKVRASYLFNTTISGIEAADVCLIIGSNPRIEAPIINARIRKTYLNSKISVALIGESSDLTYPYLHLGNEIELLKEILQGRHEFSKKLEQAKRPMLILGMSALQRSDGASILKLAKDIADRYNMIQEDFNGFNVLHSAASRVGALDLGFIPASGGKDVREIVKGCANGEIDVLYLLGADEINMEALGNSFVIYQGHHGDKGAHRADVILPGSAYTEKNGTYVNTEGRVQKAYKAVSPVGEAKEDWQIICELAKILNKELPYDSLNKINQAMIKDCNNFSNVDQVAKSGWGQFGEDGSIENKPFINNISNFYMTDSISRASQTMAKCTQESIKRKNCQEAA